MAERSKALDSKSSKGQLFGGSNPPFSVPLIPLGNEGIPPKNSRFITKGGGCFYANGKKGVFMIIKESAEDYLEAILYLRETNGYARSIDVARHLGITKPSVSVAMKNLRNEGYIEVDDKGSLYLTEKGSTIAEKTYERHVTIKNLLIQLGVDPQTAAKDACRMEHAISDESFNAIKEHAKTWHH